MSLGVDEDVGLEERECVTNMWGRGTYDLDIPVDDVLFVHIFHAPRYFQQLASRRGYDEQRVVRREHTNSSLETSLLFLRYSLRLE